MLIIEVVGIVDEFNGFICFGLISYGIIDRVISG